jgi:hypothetical protein
MKLHLKKLEEEVSMRQNTSVHPHRFGGREFQVETRRPDTSVAMEPLISPCPVQYAMHC